MPTPSSADKVVLLQFGNPVESFTLFLKRKGEKKIVI
jgi:hypothetical protein